VQITRERLWRFPLAPYGPAPLARSRCGARFEDDGDFNTQEDRERFAYPLLSRSVRRPLAQAERSSEESSLSSRFLSTSFTTRLIGSSSPAKSSPSAFWSRIRCLATQRWISACKRPPESGCGSGL
jgi:hypothetical protein